MTDPIETLARLRKLEQDEAAAELAQARGAVEAAEAELVALAERRRREAVSDDPRLRAAHSDWIGATVSAERRIRQSLQGLRAVEDARRADLADRVGQRKAAELVAARRAEEARRAVERKRQLVMDAAAVDRLGRD